MSNLQTHLKVRDVLWPDDKSRREGSSETGSTYEAS
jgi:hypothetical protein